MLTLGDRTKGRVRFDGWKDAAAPIPLLGALGAPAVRIGLPPMVGAGLRDEFGSSSRW